ncbi:hypothetical protein LX32DRAFT_647020 [Colletotrichum zoysiae]|uniref:Uncharacterized protein n=1 Tax=Colletotrichum zoysiae TaxID=1216348 RepID=A0AAD9H2Z9_9PEZI|nr:hypothetical protein LX32DRAFT_647020 [Colletotrichum zoysiae]
MFTPVCPSAICGIICLGLGIAVQSTSKTVRIAGFSVRRSTAACACSCNAITASLE